MENPTRSYEVPPGTSRSLSYQTSLEASCSCGHVPEAHYSDGGSSEGCSLCACGQYSVCGTNLVSGLNDRRTTSHEVPGTRHGTSTSFPKDVSQRAIGKGKY